MTTPVVTLAGKEYPVPELVPLQQRELLPALKRALDFIRENGGKPLSSMNREFIEDGQTIVYWGAIWPNDETIDMKKFLRMKITSIEIMKAVPVIQMATGLFEKAPAEGAAQGEAEGGSPTNKT